MPRTCEICGRGTSRGFSVSHSNIKTKKIVKINLQSKMMNGKKTKACASCIKTSTKTKK